jgi:hypothetical protein
MRRRGLFSVARRRGEARLCTPAPTSYLGIESTRLQGQPAAVSPES